MSPCQHPPDSTCPCYVFDQARVPDSKKPAFHKKAKKSSADCQAVINDVKSMAKKKKATYVHH